MGDEIELEEDPVVLKRGEDGRLRQVKRPSSPPKKRKVDPLVVEAESQTAADHWNERIWRPL